MDFLERLVTGGQESALQAAVYRRGELVLDVTAGPADSRTLFHGWSAGKSMTSTVVHVLAERGIVDYDAPVADYWPEFGTRGATVGHVLTHSAGVPQAPAGVTLGELRDWGGMCARIAALPALWEPGTATGYHALTFGYILGEVVRRATGRPIADVLRDDVAGPLGVADELFFGVPAEHHHRVAVTEDGNWPAESPFPAAAPPAVWPNAALGNNPDYLSADIPCAGTMTARAAARMFAALLGEVDGVRLVSSESLRRISAVVTAAPDRILGAPVPKCLGYFVGLPDFVGSMNAFGCKGSGGSVAFADPDRGLAMAFMRNRMVAPPADGTAETVAHVLATVG